MRPHIDYIFVTHGHEDHLGRVAELRRGIILASKDVCQIAHRQGVPIKRLFAVKPGDEVDHVRVLPGYSATGCFLELWARLWGRKHELAGGTPLSFLVEDKLSLLHIGDAYRCPLRLSPDILCLPWRRAPLGNARFQRRLIEMVHCLSPRYIIPVHFDIPPWEADPGGLRGRVEGEVIIPVVWTELD